MMGYDYYEANISSIIDFLDFCKKKKIIIHNLQKNKRGQYLFYASIIHRITFRKIALQPIYSVGIIHYCMLLLFSWKNLIGIFCFCFSFYLSTHYIFKINIIGTNLETNSLISDTFEQMGIEIGNTIPANQELVNLYDTLKLQMQEEIDYLNIYLQGSVFNLEYTDARGTTKTELSFENIVAIKDGVIQRIEVEDGNVLVEVNDYVKIGDLLVSNTIVSSSDEVKLIPVEGQVYAYTYYTVNVSMQSTNDEAEDFAYLLLKARGSLTTIDKIDKEIILKYDIIDGNRILEIQYTCIENIGTRGEVNEEGN